MTSVPNFIGALRMAALCAALSVASFTARAAAPDTTTISLHADGFVILSPGGGRFVLGYPTLVDDAKRATKPVSATVSGNTASIEYAQGAKLAIQRTGGAFTLHFTGLTPAARELRMEMTLPGEFKDGAKWQIKGQDAKPFPAQLTGEGSVFRGEPRPVTITPPGGGAGFTIAMPYGWQQMQDGRQWNSSNFDYLFTTAMPRGEGTEAWFTFKLWAGGADREPADEKPKAAPVVVQKPKTSLHLAPEGLAIEAGTMGQFTLKYPVFVGAKWDDIRKPIETKVSGNTATIKFDADARIDVAWQPADGTLVLTPVNVPTGVKGARLTMLIDFGFADGGSWKAGDGPETPFPQQKPAKPHLFQGNAASLKLRNVEGATLTIAVPQFSYQQITDNREWGWKIFGWQFDVPCSTGAEPMKVKVTLGAPSGEAVKLVDRFGQTTRSDFPAKVKTEAELKQDVQAEAAWLAALQPPAADTFGGLPGSGAKLGLKRTGFFHVEKKDDRWILVDPEGNAFFHLGICGFNPSDDFTYIAGREHLYEWLPQRDGDFKTAYHTSTYWHPLAVSFHLANTIRKTGRPYDSASYTARMIERARKWGFNSAGAFGAGDTATRRKASFPHVASLPLSIWDGFPDVPGTHGAFDPYSDKLRAQCEKQFSEKLPAEANDPLLIGYFLNNEPLYEEIPAAVAALDGTHPCKRRLAQVLEEKYKTIDAFNTAWETTFASFTDVAAQGLPVKTASAQEDMRKFTGMFLDAYFRVVSETFHKYDKNHMLIGNRLQPGTINNETLCRLSGKYLDIVSFNYYTYGLNREMLARVHGWIGDKPMFFSEFFFSSSPDSGLRGGGNDVSSQRERGMAYRQYVEQAAALGYVVGIEWFTLVDQATTGRFFEKYNGESANTGLISVTDRPWKAMIEEMIKTNYDIYPVFFGQRPPFVFDDPRFKTAARK